MAGSPAGYGPVEGSQCAALGQGERPDPIDDALEAVALLSGELIQTTLQDLRPQVEGGARRAVLEASGVFLQRRFAAGAYALHDDRRLRENLGGYAALVSGSKIFDPTAEEKGLAHRFSPSLGFAPPDVASPEPALSELASSGFAAIGRRRTRRLRWASSRRSVSTSAPRLAAATRVK